ncbi:hypothetical protein [Pararhizobium sp. PWRC1-1]
MIHQPHGPEHESLAKIALLIGTMALLVSLAASLALALWLL